MVTPPGDCRMCPVYVCVCVVYLLHKEMNDYIGTGGDAGATHQDKRGQHDENDEDHDGGEKQMTIWCFPIKERQVFASLPLCLIES